MIQMHAAKHATSPAARARAASLGAETAREICISKAGM